MGYPTFGMINYGHYIYTYPNLNMRISNKGMYSQNLSNTAIYTEMYPDELRFAKIIEIDMSVLILTAITWFPVQCMDPTQFYS